MNQIDHARVVQLMKLATCTCDTNTCTNARKKTLVVELYHNGTPVLSQCRDCNPYAWDMAAEAQKEMWLRG